MKILRTLSILLLFYGVACATFKSQQLFVIQWGPESNQLKHTNGWLNFIPEDSSYDFNPGSGPSRAFIDNQSNIVLVSSAYCQIKGFQPDGNLLFDLSKGIIPNFSELCWGDPSRIFIDSLQQIYLTSFPFMNYIPVFNYTGELQTRIYPFEDTANSLITLMTWSTDGSLFVLKKYGIWVHYKNNEFTKTGCAGFLASDGYFYSAKAKESDPNALLITRRGDLDSLGNAGYKYVKEISLGNDTLSDAEVLFGGDGNSIYINMGYYNPTNYTNAIWVFDRDFNKIDELVFPPEEEESYQSIKPFVTYDGSIYQFVFGKDGLHVIKWTKQ
jgi:hypothetical protein